MKPISIFATLFVVIASGPALAADLEYRGALVSGVAIPYGVAIPARPIVVPDCDDRAGLRSFRCVGNRVYVNQDEEPWVDRITTIRGYRARPYERLYQRPWGR